MTLDPARRRWIFACGFRIAREAVKMNCRGLPPCPYRTGTEEAAQWRAGADMGLWCVHQMRELERLPSASRTN